MFANRIFVENYKSTKVDLSHGSKLYPAHLKERWHRCDQDAQVGDGEAQQVDIHHALGGNCHIICHQLTGLGQKADSIIIIHSLNSVEWGGHCS